MLTVFEVKKELSDTMKSLTRLFVSAIAAFATFYFLSFSLLLSPLGHLKLIASLVCAAVVARYTWQHTASVSPGSGGCVLLGSVIMGAIGFSAGFFVPLILHPEANQGPLLGIIFTGPLGFLAGAAGGAIYWRVRSKRKAERVLDGKTTS